MAKELFGTDGIRGVPGSPPLDDATLFATGRSLAAYLLREHGAAPVLIGLDTRESGPHIAALLAAGLRQAGASVAFALMVSFPPAVLTSPSANLSGEIRKTDSPATLITPEARFPEVLPFSTGRGSI